MAKEEGGRVDAGFLVGRWDNHWSGKLEDEVPIYKGAVEVQVAQCDQNLGCGLPLHRYTVMIQIASHCMLSGIVWTTVEELCG